MVHEQRTDRDVRRRQFVGRCIESVGGEVEARSLGPALFEGGTALSQLWLFIVAPVVGAAVGAVVWKLATGGDAYQTGEVIGEGVMEEEAA